MSLCDLARTEGIVNRSGHYRPAQRIDAGLVTPCTAVRCLRSENSREVSGAEIGDRYGGKVGSKRIVFPMGLVVEEEKCLVALFVDAGDIDRPANCEAKLVAVRILLRGSVNAVEKVVGIQLAIAQVLVRSSVQITAPRLCNYVDDVPRAPAIL